MVNSEWPTLLQSRHTRRIGWLVNGCGLSKSMYAPGALFERVALDHPGVVEDLFLFPSVLPRPLPLRESG